jgi:hypothetical protein
VQEKGGGGGSEEGASGGADRRRLRGGGGNGIGFQILIYYENAITFVESEMEGWKYLGLLGPYEPGPFILCPIFFVFFVISVCIIMK